MSTNVFFDLPDQLRILILDVWLAYPTCTAEDCVLTEAVAKNATYRADLPRLLASPECVFSCAGINDSHMPWIINNKVKIRSVSLSRYAMDKDESSQLQTLQHIGPTLRSLKLNIASQLDTIKNWESDDDGERPFLNSDLDFPSRVRFMENVFDTCTQLEHFSLERAYRSSIMSVKLEDHLGEIFTRLVHLKSVHLNSCTMITGAVIDAICAAPCLTDLSMVGKFQVTLDALECAAAGVHHAGVRRFATSFARLCALFPNVQEVNVTCTAADAVFVAEKCRLITTATIALAEVLGEEDVTQICQHWRSVQRLTFRSFGQLTDMPLTNRVISVLIKNCPSLLSLNVCPGERTLNLDGLVYVDREPLPLCDYPLSYHGSMLRELSVGYVDNTLERILTLQCPYLYKLHVVYSRYTYAATDAESHLYSLLNMLHVTTVKYLRIVSAKALCDEYLSALKTIDTLVIDGASSNQLTNQGIINLTVNCPTLRALHLIDTRCVTNDVGLQALQAGAALHTFTFSSRVLFANALAHARMNGNDEHLVKQSYQQLKTYIISSINKPSR